MLFWIETVSETLTAPLHSDCALKVTLTNLAYATAHSHQQDHLWESLGGTTMVSSGHGFTSGGQDSEFVFSAAMCKIQASKHYIKSLPLVTKDK